MIKVDIELFNLKINLLKREKLLILLNLTNLKQHTPRLISFSLISLSWTKIKKN